MPYYYNTFTYFLLLSHAFPLLLTAHSLTTTTTAANTPAATTANAQRQKLDTAHSPNNAGSRGTSRLGTNTNTYSLSVAPHSSSPPSTISVNASTTSSTHNITNKKSRSTSRTTSSTSTPHASGVATLIFPQSRLAHFMLDGLRGVEIGSAAHNPFGLDTRNVDLASAQALFRRGQMKLAGSVSGVDVVAPADNLPFASGSEDFVLSSHVIEHFYDPIGTIIEWLRVVRPGGYIYIIAPHLDRTNDRAQGGVLTRLGDLLARHQNVSGAAVPGSRPMGHTTFWKLKNFLRLCLFYNWRVVALQDADDKVGNGFSVVLKKSTSQ